MKKCSYCGRENEDALSRCATCQTELEVQEASTHQRHPSVKSSVICPNCGSVGDYRHVAELRSSFDFLTFMAGGLLGVVFRNAGREKKVRCNRCETPFKIHTSISKVSKAIFWLWIVPTVLLAAFALFQLVRTLFNF